MSCVKAIMPRCNVVVGIKAEVSSSFTSSLADARSRLTNQVLCCSFYTLRNTFFDRFLEVMFTTQHILRHVHTGFQSIQGQRLTMRL